jgi:hypothetical protein
LRIRSLVAALVLVLVIKPQLVEEALHAGHPPTWLQDVEDDPPLRRSEGENDVPGLRWVVFDLAWLPVKPETFEISLDIDRLGEYVQDVEEGKPLRRSEG